MLIIFPLLVYLALLLVLVNLDSQWNWRHNFLRASLLWGGWLVASTELLSLLRFITRVGLLIAWLLPLAACIAGLAVIRRKRKILWFPDLHWLRNWRHIPFAAILLIVFILTALVAWFAPPNTPDALNYHMPRVAHWAQDQSVSHFTTGIEVQNTRPPVAEFAILHFYVLAGSDRLANFVEWFSMLASVFGVALLGELLGTGIPGQLLASVFAATLPMGIVQASSSLTDYVVSFWLVCTAVEFLTLWQDRDSPQRAGVFMALAAGLGVATKPTAVVFLLPFALATLPILVRKLKPVKTLRLSALMLTICILVNAGYSLRNLQTYGSMVDPEQAAIHANELHDLRGLFSNLLRNAGLHASTPWSGVNHQISRLIWGIHFKMGLDVNDPRTTAIGEFWVRPISTAEDLTVNPLQAYLILLMLPVSLIKHRKIGRQALIYQALVLLGFVIFSYVFKWQIFGSRLHLPFFILYAPLAGVVFSNVFPKWVGAALGIGLAAAATMWLVGIQSRPLLPLPGTTPYGSILNGPRERFYFSNLGGDSEVAFNKIADVIVGSNCKQVGLSLSGGAVEYLWWVVLDAPNSRIRIEWLNGGLSFERHADPNFVPCAVIADSPLAAEPSGLSLVLSEGSYYLYMAPSP